MCEEQPPQTAEELYEKYQKKTEQPLPRAQPCQGRICVLNVPVIPAYERGD